MKPVPSILIVLALTGAATFLALRPSRHAPAHQAAPEGSSLMLPGQLIAKVGRAELRSEDLRDVLQTELNGQASDAALKPASLAERESAALDHLIENELLAQAAKAQGLKTALRGEQARQELARQYVKEQASQLPPISDAELRDFYKNHGEKFYIPRAVQVRELFLPLLFRDAKARKEAEDTARKLAVDLTARIRQGQSLEKLAQQYSPAEERKKAEVQTFRGAVMEAGDEQKVLSLRPGEVVGPLRMEGGYCIFQGVAQIRGRLIPFFQAQPNIRAYLEERRARETRQNLLDQLRRHIPVERFSAPKASGS